MSHYYTRDGKPMHFVPNESARKRGEANATRETTIKDARKHKLVPSVTTITKIVDKGDFLLEWLIKQALYSAAVHPDGWPRFNTVNGVLREDDPDFVAWAARCRADSKRQVTVKAERGSILHDAMMKAHHSYNEIEPQYLAHVDGMMEMLDNNFGKRQWIAELCFAHRGGWGGSVDLHTHKDDPDPIILDYKFKDFDENKDAAYFVYDEHRMQLGGYRLGLEMPKARCFNAFGSISHPGLVLLHPHRESDIQQGEAMFRAALALFHAKTGYDPTW
jgi:hypothetical protein